MLLEPYALDLWRSDVTALVSRSGTARVLSRRTVLGGLYQFVVVER